MIVSEYGEWQEPERPPFTMADVIRAVQEMMLKANVSFDEAMRALLQSGMPFNALVPVDGLEPFLTSLVAQLDHTLDDRRARFDLDGLVAREDAALTRLRKMLETEAGKVEGGPLHTLGNLFKREAPTPHDLHAMLKLGWQMPAESEATRLVAEFVERLGHLEPVRDFARRERFHGTEPLDLKQARRLRELFNATKQLRDELHAAIESGNLLNVNTEHIRELLGSEAAHQFDALREKLLSSFNDSLEQTGLVDTEDGIYKLTPAAARRLGTEFLTEVFSFLRSDGLGKHAATKSGEGQIETVRTRPYQFGDSLAHLDVGTSLMNAVIRDGPGLPVRVRASDFEVHETRATARTAIAVLLDQSGSMARFGRFYNAKKVALALDALVRTQFPEDRLYFIGFATFARQIGIGDVPALAPKPVTHFGSTLRLSFDFETSEDPRKKAQVPAYFTNTQKGLELARRLLTREECANRHIFLITDGVPTAYYLGTRLKLTYPPALETFHETMREVHACTREQITINTFMLTSDWEFDAHGEREFVEAVARINRGRILHPSPDSLTRYVLTDYLHHKKKQFSL